MKIHTLWRIEDGKPYFLRQVEVGDDPEEEPLFRANDDVVIVEVDVPRLAVYLGVPIPAELQPNWDGLEAHWWRRGVGDAVVKTHG